MRGLVFVGLLFAGAVAYLGYQQKRLADADAVWKASKLEVCHFAVQGSKEAVDACHARLLARAKKLVE